MCTYCMHNIKIVMLALNIYKMSVEIHTQIPHILLTSYMYENELEPIVGGLHLETHHLESN